MSKTKVYLINYTKDAIPTMCYMRRVMHAPVPNSLEELKKNPKKWLGMNFDDYFKKVLVKDHLPTFLEAVYLFFKIENISRACTHQLVRHRIGFSYSQQSLRCVNLPNFADNESFVIPSTVKNKEAYIKKMKIIQKEYNEFLESGESIQDARALLPMGIQTTLTFSCNLRALIGMVNKRLCLKAQEEVREIASQIRDLVITEISPLLSELFGPPCKFGKCMVEEENERQFREKKLSGKQNTDHCCPLYIKKFKGGNL